MYGGDESSALVVDVGYDTTKAGYAGEDCPKVVFSSALGVQAGEDGAKKYSVGELNAPLPGLEAASAFTDGLITNWEGYEQASARPAVCRRCLRARCRSWRAAGTLAALGGRRAR